MGKRAAGGGRHRATTTKASTLQRTGSGAEGSTVMSTTAKRPGAADTTRGMATEELAP